MKAIILTLAAATLTFAQSVPAKPVTAPETPHSAPAHQTAKHAKKVKKTVVVKPAAHRVHKHKAHRAAK